MPSKLNAPQTLAQPSSAETTIAELISSLAPGLLRQHAPPTWPPDVFALAATCLQKSGAYRRVVDAWPPKVSSRPSAKLRSAREWEMAVRELGKNWRQSVIENLEPPVEVKRLWNRVRRHSGARLSEVSERENLCNSLLELCAIADEACEGIGLAAGPGSKADSFASEAIQLLRNKRATLCKIIHPSRARVLPKLHTPRNGLTLRSLTHNLALIPSNEVEARWFIVPSQQRRPRTPAREHSLNLMVLPWPQSVQPSQFCSASPREGSLLNMPPPFGFFRYTPSPSQDIGNRVSKLLSTAKQSVGRIDGVVFPELALSQRQYQTVASKVLSEMAFLIAGVADQPRNSAQMSRNYLAFAAPIIAGLHVYFEQHKHHRWKLDRSQITQYGIGTELNPRLEWWEHMELSPRTLNFVSLRPWLTMASLICEDLARQDPVSEIVRAVGPNLLIAHLLDAPQLTNRWPARYATVFADDPGCSVLTVTSLGMSELSRPFGTVPKPRVIALWKDALRGTPIEIELPQNKSAAVLNLTVEDAEEYTADGRSDRGTTSYPVLSGVHFL